MDTIVLSDLCTITILQWSIYYIVTIVPCPKIIVFDMAYKIQCYCHEGMSKT